MDDVAEINTLGRKWSLIDYAKVKGNKNKDIERLMDYIDGWGLSFNTVAQIFGVGSGSDNRLIKNGTFIFDRQKEKDGIITYRILKDIAPYWPHWKNRGFIAAVRRLSKINGFDSKVLIQKISLQPRSLVKCVSTEAYFDMLREIYNYRNKLKLAA